MSLSVRVLSIECLGLARWLVGCKCVWGVDCVLNAL